MPAHQHMLRRSVYLAQAASCDSSDCCTPQQFMPVTLVNMGKTNMTTMLTVMLLVSGVMAANVLANKEGMVRRESSTSSLSIMSGGEVREASVAPHNKGVSNLQINTTGVMMEAGNL